MHATASRGPQALGFCLEPPPLAFPGLQLAGGSLWDVSVSVSMGVNLLLKNLFLFSYILFVPFFWRTLTNAVYIGLFLSKKYAKRQQAHMLHSVGT